APTLSPHKPSFFITSTLIKQTLPTSLIKPHYHPHHLYIIHAPVTPPQSNQKHQHLLKQLIKLPSIKLLQHPHLFLHTTQYQVPHFHYIVQFTHNKHQQI
ncbi:DUF3388 domain-containing protein, partial [Staphylococcus pettenkoferi]|uniref:DUF3388 domain-containing protein n=1 Tax=Staphylococcus pettenkoferi TaxID=170573 RepID=UPI00119CA9B8